MSTCAPNRARPEDEWGSAVDHLNVMDLAGFNGNAISIDAGKIPPEHRENWAEFNTEVLTHLQHATTDLERDWCYKLMIVARTSSLLNTKGMGAATIEQQPDDVVVQQLQLTPSVAARMYGDDTVPTPHGASMPLLNRVDGVKVTSITRTPADPATSSPTRSTVPPVVYNTPKSETTLAGGTSMPP
ncbi:hypothetical protein T492DRAFT_870130 [Pavlovales sp. CCMP2436]|nr:hypothetical protein T492DRAFT_870130 [Pavlovales sp. CCMP2436]